MIKAGEQWLTVPAPGVAGWNSFLEAEQIADNECPEVKNVSYQGGFIAPRPGSVIFATKPSHASGDPLQTIEVGTSDGIDYIVAVYGNEFFLRNPLTNGWVLLNNTFQPTETDLYWGYINWNNGRGDDRLYACNGVDSFLRWNICVTTVGTSATTGASTVTLTDGTRFPSSGTLVIKSDGNEHYEPYTSRSGNVITLTGTLSANITAGESVTVEIIEKASMEKGKVLGRHQSRLFSCNRFGSETSGYYSVTNDPENFTTGTTVTAASTFTIADGNGGITGIHDFGKFLLIEKDDSHHVFEIKVAADLGSKLDKIQPIISGVGVGTLSQQATVKTQNTLYYPTRTEGFISLNPATSGDSASTGIQTISQKIQNYVTEQTVLDYCRGTVHKQYVLWSTARIGATENSFVLAYDLLRQAWTRWEGWGVKDWARANNKLYYMENQTGSIMECFTKDFNDNNNPYEVSFYTKRFNFGAMSQAKAQGLVYVQGYMTPATELYIDVMFNEAGILGRQTYKIERGAEGLIYSEPLTNAQGQFILGSMALGYVTSMEIGNLSFFRTYLGIDISKGYYNIQLRPHSNKEAFWAITGIGANPEVNKTIDPMMVMSPVIDIT